VYLRVGSGRVKEEGAFNKQKLLGEKTNKILQSSPGGGGGVFNGNLTTQGVIRYHPSLHQKDPLRRKPKSTHCLLKKNAVSSNLGE